MSDTWVAVDGLGRSVPTHAEVGPPRPNKFVGVFYFLWLGQHSTDGPYDISRILTANPDAIKDADDPAWGPAGHFHHWAEPYFGYYLSEDTWVIRKHAEMLVAAGVDAIFFDVTNGFTYANVYHALLDTYADIRADGDPTPQVAFLAPFGNPTQVVTDLYTDLYAPGHHRDLWFGWEGKPLILADPAPIGLTGLTGDGSDPSQLEVGHTQGQTFTAPQEFVRVAGRFPTWSASDSGMTLTLYAGGPAGRQLATATFTDVPDNGQVALEVGQPLAAGTYYLEQSAPVGTIGWWTDPADSYAGGSAILDGSASDGDRALYLEYTTGPTAGIRDFFTFRKPQASYFVGPTGPDQWGWLEVAPQHVFRDDEGNAEQMTVGVAQNAVDGRLGAMSEPGAYGRSYHDHTLPSDTSLTADGLNVQEQWDRALAVDPEFVFVTGWNEWVAQRLSSFNGVDLPVMFVDQFDWEHSRDIEPCRGRADEGFPAGNSFQDAYYYQLVANIRRFKGARPMPAASAPRRMQVDGHFRQWANVQPEYRDHIGDTQHRNQPGWGDAGPYVNTSGRNDIVAAKVARDSRNVYFYARTRTPITEHTGRNWMLLLIDITGDPATGWEGFDFIVNRRVLNPRRTLVEMNRGGWSWRRAAEVNYAVHGTELELAIPRRVLGLSPRDAVRLDFKWVDNMQHDGDILDLMASGDAAPSGRFRYRYTG